MSKPVTKLVDLEVNEVSLVDKGAIGEVFTIIKSESGEAVLDEQTSNEESINKNEALSNIIQKLTTMQDSEFISIMNKMMDRYNELNSEINKGGQDDMNEEAIKALVTQVVSEAMDTVNKNFVSINKSIDEIQKKLAEDEASKADSKKEEEEEKKLGDCVTKSVQEIGEAVKGLAETVSAVTKQLETLNTIGDQVKKLSEMNLDEKLSDVTKRLETIEKQDLGSNSLEEDETITKGAKKDIIWKSFFGQSED